VAALAVSAKPQLIRINTRASNRPPIKSILEIDEGR
jgi:hypothetical protein